MKKYLIILLLPLLVFTISCEDAKEEDTIPNINPIGTWMYTHAEYNSNADCSGDWIDYGANAFIDSTRGYVFEESGEMYSIGGFGDSFTYPVVIKGNTGTVNGVNVLTFIEQDDGNWIMWWEMPITDPYDVPLNCDRNGFTKQ